MNGSVASHPEVLHDILISTGRIEATLVQLEKRIEDIERKSDTNGNRIAIITALAGFIGMGLINFGPPVLSKLLDFS